MPKYELLKVDAGSTVFDFTTDVEFENAQWIQVDRQHKVNGFHLPKDGYILFTETCLCFSSGWTMSGNELAVYIPYRDGYVGVWVDGLDLPCDLEDKVWCDYIDERNERLGECDD